MTTQKHLDVEMVCPVSGMKIKGIVVPLHRMPVMQCDNGALFARCPNHVVRAFISDFSTVREIMGQAVIVQVTHKNSRKKEKSDGKT